MTKKARVQIFVSGLVQGVFFRSQTKSKAKELGLFGWVRNLTDGRVEISAEGEKDELEELINWVRKGPGAAKVENLAINWQEFKDEFDNFEINY